MTLILNNQITVGTSIVQGTDSGVSGEFWIKAHPNNAGVVYVGGSGVTTSTGFPLSASEVVIIKLNNLNSIYFIASEASQKVAFICYEQ